MAELSSEVAVEVARFSARTLVASNLLALGVGLTAGAVAGYFYTRSRLELQYEAIAEDEITEMRNFFHQKAKQMERERPELKGLTDELGYAPPPPIEGTVIEDPGAPNVGVPDSKPETLAEDPVSEMKRRIHGIPEVKDEWDYEVEKASRSPDRPYVIHLDEKGETEYNMVTLTYYEADDVLCDDGDKVIEGRNELVGEDNLDKFGHGSGDAYIVYIRNDKLAVEIELVRSPNSYAEEVHGLSHSDWDGTWPFRKVRSFDDETFVDGE